MSSLRNVESVVTGGEPVAERPGAERAVAAEYEPPAIRRLGSLAELTRGGTTDGPIDGFGHAGALGSI